MTEPLNSTGISFRHWGSPIGEEEEPDPSIASKGGAPDDGAETCNTMDSSTQVSESQMARPDLEQEPPPPFLELGSRPLFELFEAKPPAAPAADQRNIAHPDRPLESLMEKPSREGEPSEAVPGTLPMPGSRIGFEYWSV